MENKRLFVSLAVDPAVARDICKNFQKLNLPWDKIKTVPADKMHLTLKFLGDTPLQSLPALIDCLTDLDQKIEPFEIIIRQAIIFGHQPRVLSLKVEDNDKLNRLYQAIDQKLFDCGLAHHEMRKYSPHLTLARVKRSAKLEEFDQFIRWSVNKSFAVGSFELMESQLDKNGPEYTILNSFDL